MNKPLGEWKVPASQLRREWPAYYDPASFLMYRSRALGGYTVHRNEFGTLGYAFASSEYATALPSTATPVNTRYHNDLWKVAIPLQQDCSPTTHLSSSNLELASRQISEMGMATV